jgi:hypothetical protein
VTSFTQQAVFSSAAYGFKFAFQYIKDADAFFYMTYYQHSFSKGDRSFLKKLVRHIKERISIFYILKGKFRMALVYTACSRRINNGAAGV